MRLQRATAIIVLMTFVPNLALGAAYDRYRSVGATTAALSTGGGVNSMSINGATGVATFGAAIPNNVGVGDVITYDSDNNASIDMVAFIASRTDSTHYVLQSATGGLPTATAAATSTWSIYRTYNSLANALNVFTTAASKNNTIPVGLRTFDTSKDLTAAGVPANSFNMQFALYADGADAGADSGTPPTGWKGNANTMVRVFAPSLSTEVGASQRHAGAVDATKARITCPSYNYGFYPSGNDAGGKPIFKLDGLQFLAAGGSDAPGGVGAGDSNISQIWITNSIFYMPYNDSEGVDFSGATFDFFAYNNLLLASGKAGFNVGNVTNAYIYNNTLDGTGATSTAWGGNAGISCQIGMVTCNVYNNISINHTWDLDGQNIGATLYYQFHGGNIANDGTSPDGLSTLPTFVNSAGGDYHLAAGDTAARGQGVDLHADASMPFSTDIDLQSRPNASWDIGFDQYVAPATNDITISNLATASVTYNSFDASIDFTNDTNANATCTLYYCNNTDSAGCNPLLGSSAAMTRGVGTYTVSISGLSSPNDPSDVLNLKATCSDADGVTGSPLANTVTLAADNGVRVSNLATANITYNAFDVSVDFAGDQNANSSCTLYYCNDTDSAGCNPTLGTAVAMTRGAGSFTKSVTGLVAPNDPSDTLNIKVSCSDADGVTGSPLSSTVTLTANNGIQISGLGTASVTYNSFDASINFTGDQNTNSSCTLYYCNKTDSPGCDPLAGTSVAMTQGAGTYTVSVAGLSTPNDPSDAFNLKVTCSDADGVTGSPLTSTVTLTADNGVRVSNLATANITYNSFDVSVDFAGDQNANSACTLYYCNDTDSAGCNPTLGTAVAMARGAGSFTKSVSGLVAPNDPTDTFNLKVSCSDADGVTGSPLTTTVTLATNNAIQTAGLGTANVTYNSLDASINFGGDLNNDAVCLFRYCSDTDSPGCDPLAGASAVMTRGAGTFTLSLSLTHPYDGSDALNIAVECVDADGAPAALTGTVTLLPDNVAPGPPTNFTIQ